MEANGKPREPLPPEDSRKVGEFNQKRFEHLPAFVLLSVGILYAVGFLVVTLHYAHWGIHRISQEAFKAEYIHIGALALMPPVALASLVICFSRFGALQKRDQLRVKGEDNSGMSKQGMLLILNLVAMLFLVVIIGPKSVLNRDVVRSTLVALPVCTIVPLVLFASYQSKETRRQEEWKKDYEKMSEEDQATRKASLAGERDRFHKRLEHLRSALLVAAVVADLVVIIWMWPTLWLMFKYRTPALLQYILVSGIIGLFVERVIASFPRYQERARPFFTIAAVCVCIPLAYFDILAFTYGVYPFIPASRGGANYMEAERIQLQPVASPPQSASKPPPSQPVWLLMETESALFIALDADEDAPKRWLDAREIPRVQVVHRSAINGWTCLLKKNP